MLKKDKTTPFRTGASTGPTAEDMLMNCAVSKLKADRTPIPDNRFTLPPEYGVDGSGSSDTTDEYEYNGHEYVDLGLPSGTLWAKMNVGAESETDAGLYFAWGETQGYTASQVGTDKNFSWDDYALTEDGGSTFTKYNNTDNKTHLELTDDAAAANMGGDWHMPNRAQCEELYNTAYVTNAWVTDYQGSGINGCLFTSVSNGNTMFVPAAGYYGSDGVADVGNAGYIWTSVLNSQYVMSAVTIYFDSRQEGFDDSGDRSPGQSVRGVVGQMDEINPSGGGIK